LAEDNKRLAEVDTCLAEVPRGYVHKQREGHALGIAMPGAVNSECIKRQHDLEEK